MCGSNLHYGDVSVENGEGEGRPVATVRMHRGVFRGARWDLVGKKSALDKPDQDSSRLLGS